MIFLSIIKSDAFLTGKSESDCNDPRGRFSYSILDLGPICKIFLLRRPLSAAYISISTPPSEILPFIRISDRNGYFTKLVHAPAENGPLYRTAKNAPAFRGRDPLAKKE